MGDIIRPKSFMNKSRIQARFGPAGPAPTLLESLTKSVLIPRSSRVTLSGFDPFDSAQGEQTRGSPLVKKLVEWACPELRRMGFAVKFRDFVRIS
jgi:hypothetical protein